MPQGRRPGYWSIWARSRTLRLGGRAGTFRYLHTHDLFADAHEWANNRAAFGTFYIKHMKEM